MSTATHIFGYHYQNGENLTLSIDAEADLTTTTGAPSIGASTTIGGDGGSENWHGALAEVVLYRVALNDAQLAIAENHLAAKYGIDLGALARYSAAGYGFDVVGIGCEDNGKVPTSGSAQGLSLAERSASLDVGEYVLSGHDNAPARIVLSDLPAGVTQRWERVWAVDSTITDGVAIEMAFDAGMYGGRNAGDESNYVLLHRATASGSFSSVAVVSVTVVDQRQIVFALDGAALEDGYYTLGTTDWTASPLGRPNPVVDLLAVPGVDQVSLLWSAPAGMPISDYLIQYSNDGFHNDIRVVNDGVNTATAYALAGLTDGPDYDFRVVVLDGDEMSDVSNVAHVTLPPTISGIEPTEGPPEGGTEVTIRGTNFSANNGVSGTTGLITVSFGAVPALSVQTVDPMMVLAIAPPGVLGSVSISVTNENGQLVTEMLTLTPTAGRGLPTRSAI